MQRNRLEVVGYLAAKPALLEDDFQEPDGGAA